MTLATHFMHNWLILVYALKPVPAPSSLTVNCLTFKIWESNCLDVAMTTWTWFPSGYSIPNTDVDNKIYMSTPCFIYATLFYLKNLIFQIITKPYRIVSPTFVSRITMQRTWVAINFIINSLADLPWTLLSRVCCVISQIRIGFTDNPRQTYFVDMWL